jgi:hypothetical protein
MDFLPGLLSGLTRVTISYPFDYIRVYLQKNEYPNIRSYFKSNGYNPLKLYRGIKYPLSIVPFDRAITFKFYEDLNKRKINPYWSSFLVSMVTCIYGVPLQSINTNYILSNSHVSYLEFLKRYRANFVYRSFLIEYSRLVIGSTIYMGTYGNLRKITPEDKKYHMLNGMLANMFLWTIVYPLDTLRTEHSTTKLSILQTIQQRIKKHKIRSFYSGIGLVYIRTIPSASIGMLVYELARNMIV